MNIYFNNQLIFFNEKDILFLNKFTVDYHFPKIIMLKVLHKQYEAICLQICFLFIRQHYTFTIKNKNEKLAIYL